MSDDKTDPNNVTAAGTVPPKETKPAPKESDQRQRVKALLLVGLGAALAAIGAEVGLTEATPLPDCVPVEAAAVDETPTPVIDEAPPAQAVEAGPPDTVAKPAPITSTVDAPPAKE